jgi:hypothetical protein
MELLHGRKKEQNCVFVVKSKLKFFPEISKRVFFLLIEIPN